MFSEGLQKDVIGMLAEMNKKIDQITDRAESVNDNRTPSAMYVISPNNSGAPPAAIKSPEFHTSDEKIKIGIGELKMEKHISFGTTHTKQSPKSVS